MNKLIISIMFLFLFSSFIVGAQVVSSDQNFFGGRSGTASFTNYGSGFSSVYGSNAQTYWPILGNGAECVANQDILIQVSPAGCQPAVVRSDLLAEQNVPVFCQLDLLQVNPAINIKQIRNIRFNGRYPEYVAGVGYHPANAALRTTNQLLGTPLQNNIGYVVVVLRRNPDEKTLPKFFNFTLGASIDYYAGNALGIGATELLLRETNDAEWEVARNRQTLFEGRVSVRVKNVENENSINVELYSGDIKYSSITLQKNQPQPNSVYLPGSYCQTSLQFSYNDFVSPSAIARIKVDNDILDLYQGSRFLNNKCLVRNVSEESLDISCGRENFKLYSSIEVLKVGDKVYLIKDNFVDSKVEKTIRNIFKNNSGTFYDLGDVNVSVSYIRPVNPAELTEKSYGEYDQYIIEALKSYESIYTDYGNENKDFGDTYGEVALTNAIELAYNHDKKKTASQLINYYLESYPNGKDRNKFVNYLNSLYLRDSSSATQSVQTDDGYHLIRLVDVSGGIVKSSARVSWGNREENLVVGETKVFGNLGRLTLNRVRNSEDIEVEATCSQNNDRSKDYKGIVRFGSSNFVSACGANIIVRNVKFEDYVKLRVSPVTRSGTITNFTVGVGIEKRAIELTPAKANKKIENLNKSIQKWESISNNLGEVVKGMKAACFATAGVLTVKNFFTGLSGEALARRNVMSGEDGWTKFCQNEVNSGSPDAAQSMTACYNKYSSQIRDDVNARKSAIENTNNFTKYIESNSKYPSREGPLAGENFNDTKAKEDLIRELKMSCSSELTGVNLNSNVDYYSYSQLRDLYYNCQTLKGQGSSRGNSLAQVEINRLNSSIQERIKYEDDLKSLQSSSSSSALSGIPVDVQGDSRSISGRYYGGRLSNGNFNLGSSYNNRPAQIVYYNSEPYLAVLKEESGGNLVADEVYNLKKDANGGWVVNETNQNIKNKFSKFEKRDPTSYNNQFAPGEDSVRYFETEPYKGVPAIVPFDFDKGFYAATSQALPIFGGTKSVESSGNPSSFFVCNVMSGGRIDFYAPNYGNDECVQFNLYTGQSYSNFPGLSEQESRRIVNEAIRALKDAASQYGKSSVRIGNRNLKVGRSSSLLPGSQCQDYMSPEDCKILFNVCDPVICPSSRCNFGGEYYVSDVIQSGIVGSALLCLPNYKEGIYVPVCLTGIKAGIDGYLSILKSHQQCLQEAVETGRYVGICDQISSVYMCEFFWRQAAPLAKTVIPKVVEYAYTGGQNNVRGGGEYMTVQSSWQNAQDSAEYFTQTYAVNSLQAFNVRSFEEAGTEICRAFVSAKGPKNFEALIEPDSPPQFHAWYSAIDFTDATIPATSQYKVFYHIFAGQDRGVSYSVYLKDPPASTQYATNPVMVVAGGFVSRGQYATESKDFTAPKGYKQLCVRINDKEECGFKQVSSSFAVNYVRDSVIKDELTRQDVTTEAECVSGSVSPSAFLNPNIQSGAEEALNPAIYNRGIVRVCATSNPGRGNDESRYAKVGICGNDRMICWLDKGSVDKAITDSNVGIKDKTLKEIEQIQKQQLTQDGRFLDDANLRNALEVVIRKIESRNFGINDLSGVVKGENGLDSLSEKAFWPKDKAEVLFWKATAYKKVFLGEFSKLSIRAKETPVTSEEEKQESKKDEPATISGNNLSIEKDGRYSYITLDGKRTLPPLYFSGSRLYEDIDWGIDKLLGTISPEDGLTFIDQEEIKTIIENALGEGSYEKLNKKRFDIRKISAGIDLGSLDGSFNSGAVETR